MKRFVLFAGALLLNGLCFADINTSNLSQSGFYKNSQQLNAFGSAWKTHRTIHPESSKEITMVYGGADISRKPTLAFRTATA